MKNRRIYTIGETVYDIIFKDSFLITAKAGGSMLNTAVSLGRLGLPVDLISEVGNDQVGKSILGFLNENQVGTKYINLFEYGKTALALAHLDENKDATYSFYHDYPRKRLPGKFPIVQKDDFVLFGSFFSVSQAVRPRLIKFIKHAREVGAIIIYDPNFRKPHLHDLDNLKPNIQENISLADIVRGSNEDFSHIFNALGSKEAFSKLKEFGNPVLIYTNNSSNVKFVSENQYSSIPVPRIRPVSTVGAGDSFNAGLIYTLNKLNVLGSDIPSLKKQDWEMILKTGIMFGTHVCESVENYISIAIAEKLKLKLRV